jgi:RimJ/RimL family protein N-acetyltransferase
MTIPIIRAVQVFSGTVSLVFSIRMFLPEESALYRAIRLEALAEDPGMFGNSHALEAAYPDAFWEERLRSPERASFGLFAGDTLIGLTSIFRDDADATEAYMTQSYIRQEYRGRGLSRLLYTARLDWAAQNGIRVLTIGHRESNTLSCAANQRFGFRFTHREARTWPDGIKEDMLYYRLEL